MSETNLNFPTATTGAVSAATGSINYYDFTVTSTAIYTFKTTPTITNGAGVGDSSLVLYALTGANYAIKTQSAGNSGEVDVINVILTAGTYQLAVESVIGTVNYSLQATASTQLNTDYSDTGINNSYALGALTWGSSIDTNALPDHQLVSSDGTSIIDFAGHTTDMQDAYSFSVSKPTTVTINLTPDANSDVSLSLYDAQGNQVPYSASSFNETGVADSISANLKVGTYWFAADFVSSSNLQTTVAGNTFTANYDVSLSASQYVLPSTTFRAFSGNATTLANAFNVNNSGQPETVTISNAQYSGMTEQAAIVNNFAGEKNAGILLTTGSANDVLGHTYNQKQGVSTSDAETVKNWSNKGGNTVSMQPLTSAGSAAGNNQDVKNAVDAMISEQNKTLDADHQIDPITFVGDAASLSFDVTVSSTNNNYLSFDLLFASEEFALFADKYVDGAVVIIDGKNYALFDPNDPQSLLSVTQTNVDKGYFNANEKLADGTSVYPTEFNGVSNLISILAPIDTSLSSHHVSIAIADTNDHVLDSALFLTNLDSLNLTRVVLPPSVPPSTDPTSPYLSDREAAYAKETGSAGNDNQVGGQGRDNIFAGDGDDKALGGEGDDIVQGAVGNDSVDGGAGSDLVNGGEGNDSVSGGAGNDELLGGAGVDSVSGGEGNDLIQGGDASDSVGDKLDGGAGNDTVIGNAGSDTISAGTGADTIDAGAGADTINTGTDTKKDAVTAGGGNDTVIGGISSDSVAGGEGNDTISTNKGADTVDGGAGNDKITGGTDAVGDSLAGGGGNDKIIGGASSDTISAGTGADSVDGGLGNDKIVGGIDAVGDSLAGGGGNDTLSAGTGNDTLSAGTGADSINAGAGNDKITAGTDNLGDSISAGAGNDTIGAGVGSDSISAGDGNDVIATGTGADSVDGGAGNDRITGGIDAVGDSLAGGAGNDIISAGAGVDTINGGAGNDTLNATTALSRDTFLYGNNYDQDVIKDFNVNQDKIGFQVNLNGTGIKSFSSLAAFMDSNENGDTVFDFGTGVNTIEDTLTLIGVAPESLTASNFVFTV